MRLILLILLSHLSLLAEQNDPAIAKLRETISKTIDTQTLESEERFDWQARKDEMSALLELHHKELKLLNEELAKSGQSAPGHANSTDSLKAEITALQESRRLSHEAVARNVPRTLALAKRFPAPLISDANAELASLNAWKPTDDPREALRSILALIAKAEQFNRRFTRSTEIQDNREVEVLYLGLARAFYAGKNNTAGIGKPGSDGWVWQPRPDLHSAVTNAFATMDKKLPPAMIDLPLEIE